MAANWTRRTLVTAACASAALLSACGSSSVDSAISPSRFVVFGDGLADTGQLGSAYTINDGTINNWTTELAARYDVTLTPSSKGGWNYAYGNARVSQAPDAVGNASTPTVVKQIDSFLAKNTFQANDLVVLNAGISDAIANTTAFLNGTITEEQLLANSTQAGADLAVQVRRVVDAGAKHVLVAGTYDLGRTPWGAQIGQQGLFEKVQLALNNRLKIDINPLGGRQVLFFDVAYRVNLYQGNPGNYGFVDSANPVCTSVDAGPGIGIGANQINSALCTPSTLTPNVDPTRYLFADKVYITPTAQRRLGDEARDFISLQW